MLFVLIFAVSIHAPFAQRVQEAYAHQKANTLRTLLAESTSQRYSLLAQYRLYPLTEADTALENIPRTLSGASAREWALLSGLWSYRAGEASIFRAVDYGRHSTDLLNTAKEKDPTDPYVLLIEGQSLLFRPAIAGRDPSAAADRFSTLVQQIEKGRNAGISLEEAQVWRWLALREADRSDEAHTLHDRLASASLPSLYRQFLRDPPEV
jgi:hypothetical protein